MELIPEEFTLLSNLTEDELVRYLQDNPELTPLEQLLIKRLKEFTNVS